MENNWILPALILVPFIAGFICWIIAKAGANVTRWIALIGMTITLVLSLMLWQQGNFQFEPQGATPEWAAEFMVQWIPTFGISIHLAADGLSMLMVALTGMIGASSKQFLTQCSKLHMSLKSISAGVQTGIRTANHVKRGKVTHLTLNWHEEYNSHQSNVWHHKA